MSEAVQIMTDPIPIASEPVVAPAPEPTQPSSPFRLMTSFLRACGKPCARRKRGMFCIDPTTKAHFPAARRCAARSAEAAWKASWRNCRFRYPIRRRRFHFTAELLDLRANPRLLRTAVSAVSDRPRLVAGLPRVVSEQKQEEPRVAAIAAAYLRAVDGIFSGPTLSAFSATTAGARSHSRSMSSGTLRRF